MKAEESLIDKSGNKPEVADLWGHIRILFNIMVLTFLWQTVLFHSSVKLCVHVNSMMSGHGCRH